MSAATGEGLDELREATEARFLSTLRPMDLLLPYEEGGTLSELHDVAGELERTDTADGVLVRARVPAAAAPRFERFALNGRGPGSGALALVAAAAQHAPLLAREQLVQVVLRDRLELEAGLGGELRQVPQHVPELARQRLAALVAEHAAVVADRLLDLLGDLTGLSAQPERRIGQVLARAWIRGRPARQRLVVGEVH